MSLPVTEDTPPDMLAGSMDLNVVLPNGKTVKMGIQRSTPMMDLLVQVTTAHRLSPGNHSIQAMGDRGVLPYKPSTPIGTLDAFTIKIVDKKLNSHKKAPQVPQSFLNTFRLQVNLPRSQLFVARVTPDVTLGEILTHVCTEKNLDVNKYELRNPGNLDEILELDKTLGNYKIQELSLVNKSNRSIGGLVSTADILHVKSSKHRQNSVCDSSLSSGSLGSRSTSPVPVTLPRAPPQPPIRKKRRPAPKPPQIAENETKELKTPRPVLISHSRESSDSSGYHEASVLSESPTHGMPLGRSESSSPPDTLPRHGGLPPSQSFTNLATMQPAPRTRLASSVSTASLNSTGASRKKRAPPPPPPAPPAYAEEKMKSSTLPTSRAEERIISNVPFAPAETTDAVAPAVDEPITKVENVGKPVERESIANTQTKVDVGTSKSEAKSVVEPVEVVKKPVPKPRKMAPQTEKTGDAKERKVSMSRSQTDSVLLAAAAADDPDEGSEAGRNVAVAAAAVGGDRSSGDDVLKAVKSAPRIGSDGGLASPLKRWPNADTLACLSDDEAKATKTAWLVGDSEQSGDVSPADDIDSFNWQYQLPPPPTDFRDAHSPIPTELGTVTITPDIYKEEVPTGKDETDFRKSQDCHTGSVAREKLQKEAAAKEAVVVVETKPRSDQVRLSQKKTAVMSELTNVLSDGLKGKEKSSSVTNLHGNEASNNRKASGLSYSKSFTNELPVKNLKMAAYESLGVENNRDDMYEKEIKYRNYKNLEKSISMECIQVRGYDEGERAAEEGFRKPVAPVQKKLKMAKRSSSSSTGPNPALQRKSDSDLDFDAEAENIAVLHQHFLDFLKEKKLSNDLNMKSLNVIRHILPQINGQVSGDENGNRTEAKEPERMERKSSECDRTERKSSECERMERKSSECERSTVPVKIVEFKKKTSALLQREVKESIVLIDKEDFHPSARRNTEVKLEPLRKSSEPVRRFSYHAPPAINFATWGERPKTQVFIKDEDYVTEPKVTASREVEKKEFEAAAAAAAAAKPAVSKKPSALQFKKPGVKSHYEMFSALPKKKEVTSLTLVRMEDEEKKKRKKMEEREASRVPVVCGVELKKEFKEQQQQHQHQRGNKSISVTEVTIQPGVEKPSNHSVSIYVNGSQRNEAVGGGVKSNMAAPKPPIPGFATLKRSNLMPVVKGFRTTDEPKFQSHVNINKLCNINGMNNNNNNNNVNNNKGTDSKMESSAIQNQKLRLEVSLPPSPSPPPPPPPPFAANLKPVTARQMRPKAADSANPRDRLMEDIRNFRGFNSHKFKTAQ